MLCAALHLAESHRRFQTGAAGLAERRKAVEPFERLWALACIAATNNGVPLASDGLRGVTYVEKTLRHFSNNGKRITAEFPLLKHQARTGAVGTYWAVIVSAQLVNQLSGELTHEGRQLAREFPEPPLSTKDQKQFVDPPYSHRASTTLEDLMEWSKACHLAAAGTEERRMLGDALTANERRECVANDLVNLAKIWVTRDVEHYLDEASES